MLYILPPRRSPNPPSPFTTILNWSNNGNSASNSSNSSTTTTTTTTSIENKSTTWSATVASGNNNSNNRRPPRVRLRNLQIHNKTNQDVTTGSQDDMDTNRNPKSLSECYFAGKGAALVLPAAEAQNSNRRSAASAVVAAAADDGYNNSGGGGVVIDDQGGDGSNSSSNIQKHLQSMFYLLRPEETLKMAVKLESVHPSRTRYLVVVSRMGNRDEESCLLGIDCNEQTTVGLVLKVMADTTIRLDGDGGFSVSVCSRHHIFKPVSVQAMWSALQTLHKVSSKAREKNYFQSGLTHDWVNYYEERIKSERSCLNEWHAMDNLESKRPPSPDSVQLRTKSSTERQQTEFNIRIKLKEIMMSVDLDEVTSKYIRNRLEDDLNMDLGEYKSYIDEEMLMILGQMDAPTEIFDHVYLGSEWNASNYEELQRNGVGHILNVTREIDNFFPGTFDYLNVRVYDDEKTDLLKHWDDTFKYITKAKKSGSKVLVHCKMGVSRSASVVIAYAMKAYNWDFKTAMEHVKIKRTCIKPNTSFLTQLETYQGILDAMKNKEKLQRSKSENNLKSTSSSATTATNNNNINNNNNTSTGGRSNKILLIGSAPTPLIQAELFNKYCCRHRRHQRTTFKTTTECHLDSDNGDNNMMTTIRPKSWSPDHQNSDRELIDIINKPSPIFLSLEDLTQQKLSINRQQFGRNVLMPCDNGESYSVSPNQIVHLPGNNNNMSITVDCDKEIIKSSSNSNYCCISDDDNLLNNKVTMLRAVLVKKEIWDPGENNKQQQCPMSKGENENDQNILVTINNNNSGDICDLRTNNNSNNGLIINNNDTEIPTPTTTVWTSSTILKNVFKDCGEQQQLEEFPETTVTRTKVDDLFSNQLDRVFDREEKKQQSSTTIITTQIDDNPRECPSRQNSWSSYDSACVLNYQNECRADTNNVVLSRHSSWGSGDTRCLPSRNSSWGSYDMRPRGPCYYVNENGEKVLNQSSSSSKLTTTSGSIPWTSSVDDVVVVVNNNKKSSRSSSSSSESSSSSSSSEILFRQRTDDDLYDDDPNDELVNNKSVNISSSNAITIAVDQDDDNISTTSVGGDAVVSDDDDDDDSIISRLSASAPETSTMDLISKQQQQLLSKSSSNIGDNNDDNNVISTAQCSSVKQHRLLFLENLYNNCRQKPCSNRKRSNEKIISSRGGSIVKSLKKEFEAKTIIHDGNLSNDCVNSSLLPIVVAPAPSPPPLLVSFDQNNLSTIRVVDDDLKFKNLVDIFETNQEQQQINNDLLVMRTLKNHNKQSNSNNNVRCVSCIEVGSSSSPSMEMIKNPLINVATASASSNNKKIMCGDFNKRPPIFPVVRCSNFVGGTTANSTSVAAATATSPHLMVAATVIAKAAKKQQQQQFGKSHPLARLNIKPRHNNPVYNTM